MKKLVFAILIISTLWGCKNSHNTLPSVSGGKYELLIVMNDSSWKKTSGKSLIQLFNHEVIGIPQPEPEMSIKQCNATEFDAILKPTRNILYTEISEKYCNPKIIYTTNKWAQPQCFVKILAPNDSTFTSIVEQYGNRILNFFLQAELERQIKFNKEFINEREKKEIQKLYGFSFDIPQGISYSTQKKNFYWITNNQPNVRLDIVVYSYPYYKKGMLLSDDLIAKRDSVMKTNIPGEINGSYMSTENKYHHPQTKQIKVNNTSCYEMRGLWKIKNGAAMGGPFISHTYIDTLQNKALIVEGFVFAPGTQKRNHIRYLEAILHSVSFISTNK